MKATEQYFPLVLFIMLYKIVLKFESVDEISKCDHSNQSYCGAVYLTIIPLALVGYEMIDSQRGA